ARRTPARAGPRPPGGLLLALDSASSTDDLLAAAADLAGGVDHRRDARACLRRLLRAPPARCAFLQRDARRCGCNAYPASQCGGGDCHGALVAIGIPDTPHRARAWLNTLRGREVLADNDDDADCDQYRSLRIGRTSAAHIGRGTSSAGGQLE